MYIMCTNQNLPAQAMCHEKIGKSSFLAEHSLGKFKNGLKINRMDENYYFFKNPEQYGILMVTIFCNIFLLFS